MPDDFSVTGHDTAEEVMDMLMRLFTKAAQIEQDPVDTGDGVLLYTSEVHLIDMAGRFPDESMSSLASHLGITKGAVSQTVKKLELKGYLERVSRKGDNKTVLIRLTDAGIRAFSWHRAYHAVVNDRIAREIAGYSAKDVTNIRQIFCRMEKIFDDCPETRRKITREMKDKPSRKT